MTERPEGPTSGPYRPEQTDADRPTPTPGAESHFEAAVNPSPDAAATVDYSAGSPASPAPDSGESTPFERNSSTYQAPTSTPFDVTAPYGEAPPAVEPPRWGERSVPAQTAPTVPVGGPGAAYPVSGSAPGSASQFSQPYSSRPENGQPGSTSANGFRPDAGEPRYAGNDIPSGGPTSTPAKRGNRVGILAALAVGALIGGVAGAGVFALADNDSPASVSSASNTPTNITVNDAENATAVTAVAATSGPSIVTLSVADESTGSAGTGSGVFISDDGYIVTNTHVVTLDGATGAPSISVQTAEGRLYEGTIVGTDPISDLAVVKIEGDSAFPAIQFADSDDLNVGDTAIAIGAPLGLANTVTDGIVSSLYRSITVASSAAPDSTEDGGSAPEESPFDFWQFGQEPGQSQTTPSASSTISLPVIQTDAAINPGNSGGALLDSEGRLIGINVAIASAGSSGSSTSGSIGVGFAIPANLVDRISSEIIENGTGSHGLLGAGVNDVTSETSDVVGALIESVTAGGAADTAGLQAGDVVTAINGVPVTGRTDLTAQVRALAAGASATIEYVRDGESASVDVTLGSLT